MSELNDETLGKEDRELILRALSYYQIHLFDELSKKSPPNIQEDTEYRKTSGVIKKVHKTIEKHM